MSTIVAIRDALEALIAGTTPRVYSEIGFVRLPGGASIETLEHSALSTARQFEVRPGLVVGRGPFDGNCYEMLQEIEVFVRYGIDPRSSETSTSSWRTVRGMAASDLVDLTERIERPPMATWLGVLHNIRIESTELPSYTDSGEPVYLRLTLQAHYSVG